MEKSIERFCIVGRYEFNLSRRFFWINNCWHKSPESNYKADYFPKDFCNFKLIVGSPADFFPALRLSGIYFYSFHFQSVTSSHSDWRFSNDFLSINCSRQSNSISVFICNFSPIGSPQFTTGIQLPVALSAVHSQRNSDRAFYFWLQSACRRCNRKECLIDSLKSSHKILVTKTSAVIRLMNGDPSEVTRRKH